MKNKDDECFGDDIEEIPDTDFDFEGNLALFDKAAVFEEIDTYERRSGTRSRGIPNERPTRYRHDENILESEPIVYRRITVPHNVSKEFCTGKLTPHPAGYPPASSAAPLYFGTWNRMIQILSQSVGVGSRLSGMVIGPLYCLLEMWPVDILLTTRLGWGLIFLHIHLYPAPGRIWSAVY